jgi:hypothetical protein
MALVSSVLKSSLQTIFTDTSGTTAEVKADQVGSAIDTYTKTGVPKVKITGEPESKGLVGAQPFGLVSSGIPWMVTLPGAVTGDGVGGIDSDSAGSGLSSGKSTLKSDLLAVFSKVDGTATATTAATDIAAAITKFLKSAKVMTESTGIDTPPLSILPTVSTSSTVGVAPFTGTGKGGLETATEGAGLDKATNLVDVMKEMFKTYDVMPKNYDEAATKWADMIYTYYKDAKVATVDTGTVGGGEATVTVPITTPPNPANGTGITKGSPIKTGSGTGVIS